MRSTLQQFNPETEKLRELALFSVAGGGILGGKLLGWRTVCAVEINPYCRAVLAQRQNDKALPPFPIWDDVCTFDGRPWRGLVDVVSGGFPCQDISVAGRGEGITGARSGLWKQMARIIGEVRPRHVLIENSPALRTRGLEVVLSDLAAMGYNASWGVLGAVHAGAPHRRLRMWIVAHASPEHRGINGPAPPQSGRGGPTLAHAMRDGTHQKPEGISGQASPAEENPGRRPRPEPSHSRSNAVDPDPDILGRQTRRPLGPLPGQSEGRDGFEYLCPQFQSDWWATEPRLGRVAHGVAHRVDRIRAIGNGQVPQVAALAFNLLR